MARIQFNIQALLNNLSIGVYSNLLSGAVTTALNTENAVEYEQALETISTEMADYEVYSTDSYFDGVPIYMPFIFEGDQEVVLQSALATIRRSKNIVVTSVQGSDESVKEFINNNDYLISVSGVLFNKVQGYPKDQVLALQEFFNQKKSLAVVHPILNMLGVDEVVITSYEFPKTPFVNGQVYSFEAISDKSLELTIA